MKTIFFGTPDFVVPVATSLLNTKHCLLTAVITNPDRPVGRKQIITPSPIKLWAVEQNIRVLTPEILDDSFCQHLANFQPEIGILASYGKIIPPEIIKLFPRGIIVLHPSLLPKYRGPTPIPAAIASGETETGLSFILMDEKMDHGPILHQLKSTIKSDDTAETLLARIWKESADKLPEIVTEYFEGKIHPQPQDETQATYTALFKKEDGFIPWKTIQKVMKNENIEQKFPVPFIKNYSVTPNPQFLNNYIRALSPWPGVWTIITLDDQQKPSNGKRLKILKTHLEISKSSHSQTSSLVLDIIQLEGKNPQPFLELARNHPEICK